MKVDLHIHTTASDGSWSPRELVAEVIAAGIGLFAVTDHDSIDNLSETRILAEQADLLFVSGVEICSTLRGQQFHLLGYGFDPLSPVLISLLKKNTELMEQADEESIRKLIAQGLPIDYDEYQAYQHNPKRGGWKSLSYLTDKGLCTDVKGFFANLFSAERGIVFPDFPPPREIIETIHQAGGKAVLAHPGSAFHGAQLEETLDYFADEAIDGVECFHPCHDKATSAQALDWCRRHGLLVTGGSDCHGSFVPERRLGLPEISLEWLHLSGLLNR